MELLKIYLRGPLRPGADNGSTIVQVKVVSPEKVTGMLSLVATVIDALSAWLRHRADL